jgi:hypothetical protein
MEDLIPGIIDSENLFRMQLSTGCILDVNIILLNKLKKVALKGITSTYEIASDSEDLNDNINNNISQQIM